MPFKLGYNTNGLTGHRWSDALALIAETGYRAVALTLDHHLLDPFAADLGSQIAAVHAKLQALGLSSVIETGARFLLDPRAKHEPTLMSPTVAERAVRIDFLKRSIDIADELGSECVSFWSGTLREPIGEDAAFARLAAGCREVLDYADRRQVQLAFEPEPGMFLDTMARYRQLLERVDGPRFGLTIDIGHLHCLGEVPIAAFLREWADRLANVHIEDMRQGVHEHLRFGEGEIDFAPVLATLREIGYSGCVNVELSRHSHMAPEVLRESFAFLQRLSD
jgi:L-ribulose-5-phosphate 3-epimerase